MDGMGNGAGPGRTCGAAGQYRELLLFGERLKNPFLIRTAIKGRSSGTAAPLAGQRPGPRRGAWAGAYNSALSLRPASPDAASGPNEDFHVFISEAFAQ